MIEFQNIAEAHNYAAEHGAALIVTDGERVVVYCRCHDVPEAFRPQAPADEPVYL